MSHLSSIKTKVSERTEHFPVKLLSEINTKLELGLQNPPNNLKQSGYTLINLFYHISLVSGLAEISFLKNKPYFEVTPRYDEFLQLSPTTKYMFLLEAFWVYCDLGLVSNTYLTRIPTKEITLVLNLMCEDMEKGVSAFSADMNYLYRYSFSSFVGFLECMSIFGFCDFERDPHHEYNTVSRKVIKKLWISDFGKKVLPVLNQYRNLSYWNVPFRNECEDNIEFPGQINDEFNIGNLMFGTKEISLTSAITKPEPFQKAFKSLLPDLNDITMPVLPTVKEIELSQMFFNVYYTTKIYREIAISSDSTLEELHWIIQKAFDFGNDHLYAFFMDGKPWSHKAYFSPDGDEGPFTHEVTLGELKIKIGKKILYLFDYGDEWRFNVVLKKIDFIEKVPKKPVILKSIGEAPEQYPDYEQDWE